MMIMQFFCKDIFILFINMSQNTRDTGQKGEQAEDKCQSNTEIGEEVNTNKQLNRLQFMIDKMYINLWQLNFIHCKKNNF